MRIQDNPQAEREMVLAANWCRRMLRQAEEAARGGDSARARELFGEAGLAAVRARNLFPAPAAKAEEAAAR